jgi:hypothetical protein
VIVFVVNKHMVSRVEKLFPGERELPLTLRHPVTFVT